MNKLYLLVDTHGLDIIDNFSLNCERDVQSLYSAAQLRPVYIVPGHPTYTISFQTDKHDYLRVRDSKISCLIDRGNELALFNMPYVSNISLTPDYVEVKIKCNKMKVIPLNDY